jgi:ACS family tartrate transporter-like MFS transporter
MPLASMLGGPISGLILDHARWFGLSSWRWLLILEGFPALAGVFLTNLLLSSQPAEAGFLTGQEKVWIDGELQREERQRLVARSIPVARTVVDPRVWYLACIGFGHGFAAYTFLFWLPQMLKSIFATPSNTAVGMLVMIPNLLGLLAMILVSRHSDRTLERRYHIAASSALAGIALLLSGVFSSPFFSIVLFSAVAIGTYSFLPVFFSLPGQFLSSFSAAAGIALVTSVANLGGFVGPYTTGLVNQKTGTPYAGLICAGIFFLASSGLSVLLPKPALLAPDPSSTPDITFEPCHWRDRDTHC